MSDESPDVLLETAADNEVVLAEPVEAPPDIRNSKILNLPVQILVSVGKAQMTVEQLLNLTPDAVIDLDAHIDDPAEIFVGDRLVARGELVAAEDNCDIVAIRLVEVCDNAA